MDKNENNVRPTNYCDYTHPVIKELADSFKDTSKNQTELIQSVFEYVRDTYLFGVDLVKVKASETVKKGYGACWNKAILLISILRYYHIPSRLIRYGMKRDFQKPFTGLSYLFMNNPFYHCLVEAFVDGRWIKLDPTVDRKLYEALYAPLDVPWNIDWDGISDCITFTDKIISGPEILHDIDKSVNERVGNAVYPLFLTMYKMVNKAGWNRVIRRS